jgi:AraC-like DNA-binding protein/mannose-6-phosphate isomerase-like protein (cupin superfamily)
MKGIVITMNADIILENKDLFIDFSTFKINVLLFNYTPECISTNNHSHSCMEIHFICGGNGEFIVDFERRYSVRAGDLIVIGEGVYHEEIINKSFKMPGFCIIIDIPSAKTEPQEYAIKAVESIKKTTFLLEHNQWEMQFLFEMLSDELQSMQLAVTESTKHLLGLIMIKLSRLCMKEELQNKILQKNTKDLDRFIIDNFFNRVFNYDILDLNAKALAKKLSVSERHLNRLLNQMYGLSFNNFLNCTKLKLAKYELINTNKTVEQISENCNWTSTYLIRQFKKRYNQTPAVFRKNYNKH